MANRRRGSEDARLVKEIQSLRQKITKRLSTIQKHYGVGAHPILSYQKLDKKSLYGLNTAQLLHQKRLLKQFNEKQFTRLSGYKKYLNWEKDLGIKVSTEKDEKRMWEIYNRYVEEHQFVEQYKYEVLQVISEEVEVGSGIVDIHNKLEELFNKEINPEVPDIEFSKKFKRRYKHK